MKTSTPLSLTVNRLIVGLVLTLPVGTCAFAQDQAAPSAAPAQQPSDVDKPADLERRVRELEAVIRQMQTDKQQSASTGEQQPTTPAVNYAQSQVEQDPSGNLIPPPPAFNPIGTEGAANDVFSKALSDQVMFHAGKDGFYVRSNDGNFDFRITGQIQADYREFLNTNDQKDIDNFQLRRIRFGLESTLYKYYEFRFMPDFGKGQSIIQDAYMNVHYLDALQFEFGKFKQPFSYEQLIQDRYVPTLERSLIDQLVPARDVGAMIHGENIFNNRLDYGVSISTGEINDSGVGDTNNHKDLNGRFAIRPFNDADTSMWLRGVQVGVSGTTGIEQEVMSPASLATPDTVTFFTFNNAAGKTAYANGLRTRVSPELAYFNGPFGFLTQYYVQHQQIQANESGAGAKFLFNVPFTGYFAMATLLLTGETRTTYSQAIDPIHPFNPFCPCASPGAWELVARVSKLNIGDEVFSKTAAAQLANPATNSDEATEMTLGFNWYLTKFVRVQFNYAHDWFGQPVLEGSNPATNKIQNQDSLSTRFQIIF
jgi:phosphate-selective porin OprO and OprP